MAGVPVVELVDVDREFTRGGERVHALARVSLKLQSGEFVFLTGPSGAGKSTLLRLVLGLDDASRGEVFVLGRSVHRMGESERRKLRREVGVVFQDHRLISSLNVRENVELPLLFQKLSSAERERRVIEILETVQMRDHAQSPVTVLSAGEKQRVGIARALVVCPRILVADEPTGNLDPVSARSLIRMLRELKGFGTTVFIATHDMGLVRDFGGRVLELVGGAIPPNDLSMNSKAYKVPRFFAASQPA